MSRENDIMNSFNDFIVSGGVNAVVYNDTSFNLDLTYEVRPNEDIQIGEQEFDLLVRVGSNYVPAINPDDKFLLYRYITFLIEGVKYKAQIIEYDNTTGKIKIDSSFDIIVPSDTDMSLIILDSIFIRDGSITDLGLQSINNKYSMIINVQVKCKEDSSKERTRSIIDNMVKTIALDRRANIYDDVGQNRGYMFFQNNGNFSSINDKDNNIITSFANINVHYYR